MHRLALAVLAALLLLPATAGASTTLTLRGAAVSSLRAQGVKLSAVAPARLRGSKLTLGARSSWRAGCGCAKARARSPCAAGGPRWVRGRR